ncbi:hypothetical protein DPMN_028157 [Dreissena polymorpha]|uniref:Uncharacterized protein n=1 Tax=Dreissena polymorpha TaxID=45954 RepID=A0A9D4LUW9_DREPO|nr:hypothetical protein DPMN_028157 [Dreissena polymorpha]
MPMDCTCHEVDMSEPLKCGPCNRCKRRADQMQHQGKWAKEGQVEYAKASSSGPSDTRPPSGETSTAPSAHRRPQWMAVMSSQEMARLQCEDPDIRPLYIMKRDGEIITHEEAQSGSPETHHYYLIANDLVFHDDLLWRRRRLPSDEFEDQIVAPAALHKKIIRWNHDSLTSGHMGLRRPRLRWLVRFTGFA